MKRKKFIVPGMMTTYANLKKHTRERSQAMAQDFQTRWLNRAAHAKSVSVFCGVHMLDEQPWKHYLDPAGNGKLRDWVEAITGDDFDDVLRWIYGNDLETHRRWTEIDILDQHPSRAQQAQAIKNEVKALFDENPDATQEEVAQAVGVRQERVAQIISESGNLPDSLITVDQEVKLQGKSEKQIRKERKLKREHPQIWEDFLDGKYRSLHAACVAAGAVKVKTPLQQVLHWMDKCDGSDFEVIERKLDAMRAR